MKKFFSFFAFFILGIIFNNLISTASAYINSNVSARDIYGLDYAIENIVKDKISSYNYDFSSEVKRVVESCNISDGKINC